MESLSCQRKAINNNEQDQDYAGTAPSTSPRSGGPAASGVWVPAAHGSLAQGLRRGSWLHPLSPSGLLAKAQGAGEMMPVEFCFAEQYWDLTGNSLGWFRAVVCTDEACV